MHPLHRLQKPIVPYGTPPLGRLTIENGQAKWEGELVWETAHGNKAKALWIAGHMVDAREVYLDDDEWRIVNLAPGDVDGKVWRYVEERGDYVFGTVQLQEDEIFFEEGDDPPLKEWPTDSLPTTIINSVDAQAFADDKDFAIDVYGALCSVGWTMKSSGKEYVGTWYNAAEIVAELRNKGEIASDFFLSGNEGIIAPKAADLLGSLGWAPGELNETAEGRHHKALKLLQVTEAKAPTEVPAWYVHWIGGYSEEDTPAARMHRAAFSGKVSYPDWCRFWELIAIED